MMLCIVIKGPSFEEVHEQISKALNSADLVELRLDCFEMINKNELELLRLKFSIPMIFTLRSCSQGGHYNCSEQDRLSQIRLLMSLQPEYFDLENDVPSNFINEITAQFPNVKLILSYHNFRETPEDFEGLYRRMKEVPAFFYKIAVMPQNSLDVMRFMCWKKEADDRVVAISLGPYGQFSRVIGRVIGNPITYASLDENQKTDSGQLSAKTQIDLFRFRSLHSQTALYGLIGNPVDQSISDVTHNAFMGSCDLEAVYLKINVNPRELGDYLKYAKQLSFRGLSVTMPLKVDIIPFLEGINIHASKIGAVNTLVIEENKVYGFNTDGVGALDAIEKEFPIQGKRIVIIGAGGASKAIAYEALQRGGLVTIFNRDEKKAIDIASQLNCMGKGISHVADEVKKGYDLLIKATPISHRIDSDFILPNSTVMDITTNPRETPFLKQAKLKNCRIIYGYRMFIEQAANQFDLWFNEIDKIECKKILESKALESLR